MMKKVKQIVSIVLALCLLAGMFVVGTIISSADSSVAENGPVGNYVRVMHTPPAGQEQETIRFALNGAIPADAEKFAVWMKADQALTSDIVQLKLRQTANAALTSGDSTHAFEVGTEWTKLEIDLTALEDKTIFQSMMFVITGAAGINIYFDDISYIMADGSVQSIHDFNGLTPTCYTPENGYEYGGGGYNFHGVQAIGCVNIGTIAQNAGWGWTGEIEVMAGEEPALSTEASTETPVTVPTGNYVRVMHTPPAGQEQETIRFALNGAIPADAEKFAVWMKADQALTSDIVQLKLRQTANAAFTSGDSTHAFEVGTEWTKLEIDLTALEDKTIFQSMMFVITGAAGINIYFDDISYIMADGSTQDLYSFNNLTPECYIPENGYEYGGGGYNFYGVQAIGCVNVGTIEQNAGWGWTGEIEVMAGEGGDVETTGEAAPTTGGDITSGADFSKSSMDFVGQINAGWNLGNSLDVDADWGGETGWGNPRVTPELIDAVADRGFDLIRIPVTWAGSIGAAPDYTIDSRWINRVKQIVDYAVANDMYIIVNLHHDGGTGSHGWLNFDKIEDWDDEQQVQSVLDKFAKVWTQIANYFKDYDEHLIFEGFNEVRDGENWGGYDEAWEMIDRLNQTFVDTVRATGGNNAQRYLMMNTYAASAGMFDIRNFTIPNDPANHLIGSVHYYAPGSFAGPPSMSGAANATTYDTEEFDTMLRTLITELKSKFIDNGVPVIIGEMGSVNKNNTAERIRHIQQYVNTVGPYGIKLAWWDNNGLDDATVTGGETFGLLNWRTLQWTFGDIADAMIEAANQYVNAAPEPPSTEPPTTEPPSTEPPVYIQGDVTGDKFINNKDLARLKAYLADDAVELVKEAADVAGKDGVLDGYINNKDYARLKAYLADDSVAFDK